MTQSNLTNAQDKIPTKLDSKIPHKQSITEDSTQDLTFLGFDLSTQQLKAIVIDKNCQVLHHVNVLFDTELGEYRTKGGVLYDTDATNPNTVLAPVNMWLKAVDLCLDKLKLDGLNFGTVQAISGSAQQHGSVWWKNSASVLLKKLDFDEFLHKQLVSAFSLRNSPIWMDSSTTKECQSMEQHVGGPLRMAELTGSRAYERFTGPQIAKIVANKPEIFQSTERITLISNFLASIFIGKYAPFDVSDASGMNMMNLETKCWSDECLNACVACDESRLKELYEKLGASQDAPSKNSNIVDTCKIIGTLSDYFIERHGFKADCLVSSFTGDNPASMAGLRVTEKDVLLSLGTSDTAFFPLKTPVASITGHVLRSPIDEDGYMGLVCFKNGSITRERIRDKCSNGNWDDFSRLLNQTTRGNFGNIGFYFDLREIYPLCIGDYRFNKDDSSVAFFSNEVEIRACVESQFLRLIHHCKQMGLDMSRIERIIVTGGASANAAILSVIADVFQRSVYTINTPNSACLGASYLALSSFFKQQISPTKKQAELLLDTLSSAIDHTSNQNCPKLAIEYKPSFNSNVYDRLLARYVKLEQSLNHVP